MLVVACSARRHPSTSPFSRMTCTAPPIAAPVVDALGRALLRQLPLISIFGVSAGASSPGADVGAISRPRFGRHSRRRPRTPATSPTRSATISGDCAAGRRSVRTSAVTAVPPRCSPRSSLRPPRLLNMMTPPRAIGGSASSPRFICTLLRQLGATSRSWAPLYKAGSQPGILSLSGVAGVIYWLIGFGSGRREIPRAGALSMRHVGLRHRPDSSGSPILHRTEITPGIDRGLVGDRSRTNVIHGWASSMESTAGPARCHRRILVTYSLAACSGIAITPPPPPRGGRKPPLSMLAWPHDRGARASSGHRPRLSAFPNGRPAQNPQTTDALDAVGSTPRRSIHVLC